MHHPLPSPDEIDRATRRPLVIAAAIASAVLCPLVDELVLGGIGFLDGGPPPGAELGFYGTWGALSGAAIGALAMHLGLRRGRHPALLLATGAIGGFLYVPVLLAPQVLLSPPASLEPTMLIAPIFITIMGAIVSVPAGLAFGVLFGLPAAVVRPALEHPSHASPVRGWLAAALLSLIACAAAAVLGEMNLVAIEHALSGFATRYDLPASAADALSATLLVLGPVALSALVSGARALWLWVDLARTRRALAADTHPRWCIEDASDDELARALPWADADRHARTALREREGHAPYRGARAPVLARIART